MLKIRNSALYIMIIFMIVAYVGFPIIGTIFHVPIDFIIIPLYVISIFVFPALAAWVDATVDSSITLIAIPATLMALLFVTIIAGFTIRWLS